MGPRNNVSSTKGIIKAIEAMGGNPGMSSATVEVAVSKTGLNFDSAATEKISEFL